MDVLKKDKFNKIVPAEMADTNLTTLFIQNAFVNLRPRELILGRYNLKINNGFLKH